MTVTTGCHSDEALALSYAALRPRGDAWRHGGFDALDGSGMGGFFAALGQAFGPTDRRVCEMVDEFFCSSAVETRERWALDHGLPDGCDPFADVCEKVNAVGDTTPAYVEGVALRRGWAISIEQDFITIVQDCCFGFGQFGQQVFGAQQGVLWTVTVDLAASPAYSARASRFPSFGSQQFGDGFDCPPDIEPLRCLVRRIAAAHADLSFTTVN
ncbi:MAG: hypothetical protein DI537_08805 [Stutzerimonas stutzeri]|nr:MAG: hypothetical protein DI537_08805 [Stutzerimonas stutzeri]